MRKIYCSKFVNKLVILGGLLVVLIFAMPVYADPPATDTTLKGNFFSKIKNIGINAFGAKATGELTITPVGLVGTILAYLFGFLGAVFMILTAYGGWLWMTAAGNEEQVTKARKIVTDGVIGLVIMVFAYTLTVVIIDVILVQVGGAGTSNIIP